MARALEDAETWFVNTDRLDMRAFDIEELSNGRILLAFGGALMTSSVIYSAYLNTGSDTLGPITTQEIPRNAAGVPASTIRVLDLTATGNGDAVLTMHAFNANINGDTGMSLATQIYDGTAPLGTPRPVNPATPAEETTDMSSTVVLANGRSLVFFTEPGVGGWANLSNGIRMATFNANGQQVGSPSTVVGEFVVVPALNLQNNPEDPSAALLRNGNIGLIYKQTTQSGFPEIVFQQLTVTGAAVGGPVVLAPGGIRPELTILENDRLVASWFDAGAGAYRAQVLSANGTPQGQVFDLTTTGNGAYMNFDITALGNGNFAVSWSDTNLGMQLGQIFDPAGRPLGNAFELMEGIDDLSPTGLTAGVTSQGDDLLTWVLGMNEDGIQELRGQLLDGDGSLGQVRTGTAAANPMNGGGLDDRLDGRGGKDVIKGFGGNDFLIGGTGNDLIEGGSGLDRINGGVGNDTLNGGDGVDIITGEAGRDRLIGGAGNDLLTGGADADTLTGGSGADMFVFQDSGQGRDVITDFNSAEGDRIRISLNNFVPVMLTVSDGPPDPAGFGFHFNTRTHLLTFDRDGSGEAQRMEIAVLQGVDTLALSDFLWL